MANAEIYEYIEMFYNRIRRHSHLSGVSPEVFEAASPGVTVSAKVWEVHFRLPVSKGRVDLRTLQELGVWQTLGMVQRYAHLAPSHKAQAVERIALVQFQQIDAFKEPVMII